MEKSSAGDRACCLPGVGGVTYLQVGPRGVTVGMMNLDAVFKQLLAMNRRPAEATDKELLGMACRFNYIPDWSGVEADYAAALHRAYAAFCVRQEHWPNTT